LPSSFLFIERSKPFISGFFPQPFRKESDQYDTTVTGSVLIYFFSDPSPKKPAPKKIENQKKIPIATYQSSRKPTKKYKKPPSPTATHFSLEDVLQPFFQPRFSSQSPRKNPIEALSQSRSLSAVALLLRAVFFLPGSVARPLRLSFRPDRQNGRPRCPRRCRPACR
jgi:hypothetical protein